MGIWNAGWFGYGKCLRVLLCTFLDLDRTTVSYWRNIVLQNIKISVTQWNVTPLLGVKGGRYLFAAHCGAWFEGIITTLNFMYSLNQGCVWGNSPYEKLWNHLDNREKRDLRLTKDFFLRHKTGCTKMHFHFSPLNVNCLYFIGWDLSFKIGPVKLTLVVQHLFWLC